MSSEKKYKNIQCIAFEVETSLEEEKYVALEDDTEDYMHRLKCVKTSIEHATKSSKLDSKSTTLKIFMLPEFFFRGIKGGYDLETATKIVEELREMVREPKYKDWLFVFGTIVAYSKSKNNRFEAYNYSFVQKT